MMIAHAASVHGRDLLVKTKDSHELWFFFGEIHRSEVEEELLEMEKDARMSDASALHSGGGGESMQPKKINQMNTGMKGLRLALKGEDGTRTWRSAFMAKTGITAVTHAITTKLGGMISTGSEEAKDTALKSSGLQVRSCEERSGKLRRCNIRSGEERSDEQRRSNILSASSLRSYTSVQLSLCDYLHSSTSASGTFRCNVSAANRKVSLTS